MKKEKKNSQEKLQTTEVLPFTPHLIDNSSALMDLCRRLMNLSSGQRIGLDTEFSGPLLRKKKGGKKRMVNVYRASVTGVSVSVDGDAFYVPIAHRDGNAPYRYVLEFLDVIRQRCTAWVHNWKADKSFIEVFRVYDSMLMMHQIHRDARGKYGLKPLALEYLKFDMPSFEATANGRSFSDIPPSECYIYACADAWATLRLGEEFLPEYESLGLSDTHAREVLFAETLHDMERKGMALDFDRLASLGNRLGEEMAGIQAWWSKHFPDVSISSATQLRERMFPGTYTVKAKKKSEEDQTFPSHGVWTPIGCKKTDAGNIKVDQEAMENQLSRLPPSSKGYITAKKKLQYSELSKVYGTYTFPLIYDAEQMPDCRLHPSFMQTGTTTGRLSCSNPNLQNIPACRPGSGLDLGTELRECFRARQGHLFVVADYSQLELRILAHYCGGALRDAFREGKDPHTVTAELVGSEDRAVGKTLNFAVIYGAGVGKIAQTLGVSRTEASEFLRIFKEGLPEVEAFRLRVVDKAHRLGFVRTMLGKVRRIPELRSNTAWQVRSAERQAFNTVIQGSGADIVKSAMLKLPPLMRNMLVCQVHDELILEVEETECRSVMEKLRSVMESAQALNVPLEVTVGNGKTWAEAK